MVVPLKFIEDRNRTLSHRTHPRKLNPRKSNFHNDEQPVDVEEAIVARADTNTSNNSKTNTSLDDISNNIHVIEVADGVNSQRFKQSTQEVKKSYVRRQTKDTVTFTRGSQSSSYQCALLPHGEVRTYWDLYVSLLLVYVGTFVPYRVSFLADLEGPMKNVELFVDISFAIDIVLNFMTGYETPDGHVEIRFSKIAKQYIKTYFILDVIATVPIDKILEFIVDDFAVNGLNKAGKLSKLPRLIKILRMAKLLKILRLYRFKKWIRDIQLNYSIHHGITRLMNIVIIVLFFTHLVACLWHAIGVKLDVEEAQDCIGPVEEGWVCREDMIDKPKGHTYVAALYWSFSTLTTVGYGDINARTVEEQAYSMVMMLLGVSWYAYTVGSMSNILASFDKQNKQIRDRMVQVNAFIRETKMPPSLGSRVRRYFEYSLSRKQNGLFGYDADEILQELSNTLRTEVICFVEAELIEHIPFFEGKSPTFVSNTIQLLRPVVVQQGESIIKEGSASDEMFFLIKGTAAVYYGNSEVKKLNEGAYFGEIGCILGGVRKASIMAVTLCELRCLSRQHLNQLLGQHPSVGEDLRKVARARMKVVKSKPHPTSNPRSKKASSIINTQEKNLAKLEEVDFHNLDNATEEFIELRKHLEGMNRKLSLTSGVLAQGNHVQADTKVLEQMNRDDNEDDIEEEDDEEDEDDEINKSSLHEKDNHDKLQQTNILRQFPDNDNEDNDRENFEKVQMIISTLSPEDGKVIHDFMLNSIAHQTRRKVTEHCTSFIDYYRDLHDTQQTSSRNHSDNEKIKR